MKISYNRAEAAAATGVSVATIDRAIKADELAVVHPVVGESGKKLATPLILHDDLAAWAKGRP